MKKFFRTMLIAIIAVMASMFAFACDDSAGSGDPSDPPEHEHTYATEWTYDDTQHWHAATCEHTDEKKDLANHTKVERVTLAPTWTTKGKAKLACVCGWEGTEYELPIKDKLTPEYELPTLTATYGQGLADITLPEGFSWELPDGVEPSDIIFAGAGEIDDYKLSYIAPDDVEEKYLPVTGIEVTIAVAKATPVLELVEDSTVWVKDGIAIDSSWYAGSTEGTTAVWVTPGNVNPNSVGVHTIKLVYAESDNYVGAEESFEFTVVANPTISKVYSWTAYDAKTPTAVSYDKKIEAKHTRDGETNFNNYVAGVDYTENFNTDDEKGFSYKAQLTDDGLYFIATVKHDLILSGSSDWGSNNNIEGVLGNSKSFYLAVGQVVGTDVNSALASVNLASYSVEIAEATDKNYQYETVFTGLIPYSYLVQHDLIVEGGNGKADYVRFALAYRSGTRERIVLCVPQASATIDTATNSETIVAGNYAFRTLTQNNLNDFVDGNRKDLTITDNKYMIGEDVVTLTRYQKNTATVDGVACYLYYVDYPDFNDSFYSTSAHTKAKPFIIYPEGHSPYAAAEHAYVTANGISNGYTATEAVIDGVADDELWTNYHGYMMYAYEQGDDLPSKSQANSNARGRGVEVKAIVGDDGVYIYGVVTHSKHINYTHRTIWNNAIELQFALTPQTANWDNNSSNGYKGSAGADEPFQLKSFVFTETGNELYAGTEYAFNTEWDGTYYVSKLEAFISWNVFQNEVSNGIPDGYDLRAGIQYRSFSEYIYLKGGSATSKANIWTAHNTISDYATVGPNKFYHIDENGLQATRKTDTRFAVDGKMDDWKNTANYTGEVVTISDSTTGKWVDGRMALTADGLYFAVEAKTHNFWRHVKDASPCMLLDITIPKGSGQTETILTVSAGGLLTSAKRGAPLKGVESISVGTQIEGVGTETKDDDRYNVVIEGFVPMWFINEYMSGQLLKENDEVVGLDLLGYIFSPGAGDKNLEPFMYATWRDPSAIGSPNPSLTGNMYVTSTGLSLTCPVHFHTYSNTWTFDENQHWHAATCEHDEEKKDLANHNKTEQVITAPTYKADGSAKLVCACGWEGEEYALPKKAQETPSYTVPTGLTATDQQTLADVVLPAGFAWELETGVTPDEVALTAGEKSFTLSYTVPNDTEERYLVVTGIEVTVTVTHIHTYADTLTFNDDQHWYASTCGHADAKKDVADHTKTEQVIVAPTYTEDGSAKLVCACGWEGEEYVKPMLDQETPSYTVPTNLTATYGDTLASVTLPTGFTWELDDGVTPDEVILNAGDQEFTVTYTEPNDPEERFEPVTGIQVIIEVAKATPVLVFNANTAVWTEEGIAIDPSWYAGSTEGTTATWTTDGGVNPTLVGTYTVKLTFEETDNYEGAEESFEFTVTPDTTMAAEYSWAAYDAKTPTAVSYDRKIEAKHTRDGETDFNNFVAGVDYTENFNTDDEKGFSYKAQLTDDGLYFIATVKHDLILSGSSDWGSNNNIEGVLGGNKGFYLAIAQVTGTTVNSVLASNLASYSIEITEATDKNYKYETVYKGLIPTAYLAQNNLIVEGTGGKEDYVRFALSYRGGNKERIVLCVPTASATIDTTTNSETIATGTYAFRTVTSNTINEFTAGNTKTLTISGDKYMIGEDVVTLTRVKSAAESVDGTDCYLYYVDYPDYNDSFYSTSAHTKAKPFIIYPEGHSPYAAAEHAYVTANGISNGYTATEAVIDGVADDELWTNYHGYMMYAYEQGDDLPSKSQANSNARGRGVEVKAIVGDDGVYIYGVVTHSKHINYTHRTIWNNAIELQFALTPQTANWDNNSSNGYKGSAGADEPFQLKSFVFTETGNELYAGTEYAFNTEWDGTYYVSKLEAFISWNVFQNEVSNGIPDGYDLRAGIQYRSFSEYIYLKGGSATSKANIWTAHNTISDYATVGPNKFYHIDENGLQATRKTDTRFAVDGKMDDWKNTANYTGEVVTISDSTTGKWVDGRMALTADGLYFAVEAKTHNFWRHVKDASPCMLLDITIPKGSGQTETILTVSAGGLLTSEKRGAPVKGVESISVGTQIEGVGTETKDDDRYNVVIEGFIPMWFINEYMSAQVIKSGDEVVAVGLLGYIFSPGAGDKTLEPFMYATWRDPNTIGSPTPSLTGNMYVTSTGFSLTDPSAE